jgi:MFS transporter, DHA1 family, tetracycline resistance protein
MNDASTPPDLQPRFSDHRPHVCGRAGADSAAAYSATPAQIGLTAAAFPLAQLIGVPVMGALSDRFGRKPLLLVSQVSTCASFLMLAAASSLEMVILSRVIDGLFGANFATAQAAITDLTDEHTRTRGLGLIGAAFGFGFLIGPAISLLALEFSDGNMAMPALIAAAYSLVSIGITLFGFQETLPRHRRGTVSGSLRGIFGVMGRTLARPGMRPLAGLMFAQQFVFYAFESLLGLFLLSRIGLLGQGSALIFIYVGFLLIWVQARLIGRMRARLGDARLAQAALGLLAVGLLLSALTPEQPHPFYVQRIVENALADYVPSGTEAIVGEINVPLPPDSQRGFGGLLWLLVALVPLTIGAGLIRPALNSLMVARSPASETGAVLGVSTSFVSLANAGAPVLAALLMQSAGVTAPFLVGGLVMSGLALLSVMLVRADQPLKVAS